MKKIAYWGLLALCFSTPLFAQEKVDAPVWNVGDTWVFTDNGTIEVVNADENSYVLTFSDDICVVENQRFSTILFDKSTLHRMYGFKGDKGKKYTNWLRTIFNFPYSPGKQWKDEQILQTPIASVFSDLGDVAYHETCKVVGWEDIEVQAGRFRAIKLEITRGEPFGVTWGTSQYWYSPEVKYFVKCQYSPDAEAAFEEYFSWELTAFTLKK